MSVIYKRTIKIYSQTWQPLAMAWHEVEIDWFYSARHRNHIQPAEILQKQLLVQASHFYDSQNSFRLVVGLKSDRV